LNPRQGQTWHPEYRPNQHPGHKTTLVGHARLSPDDLAVLDHYQRWQAGDAKLLGNPWMFIHVDLDEASW
jgi:hypothetical protein